MKGLGKSERHFTVRSENGQRSVRMFPVPRLRPVGLLITAESVNIRMIGSSGLRHVPQNFVFLI
jgi:hypothetical protein